MSESKTRPVLATFAGMLSLASVGGLSVLGLNMAGIPLLPKPPAVVEAPAPKVDTRTVVAAKDSPAVKTINKLMAGSSKLDATGQVKAGGTPSLPYSCPAGNLGASYSAARTFIHQGGRVQIVASAYAAGYGAVAYDALRQSVRNCASGVGTVNLWSESIGTSPAIATDFKQSGGTTRFLMVRYGDIILHLQGEAGKLRSAAQAAVAVISEADVCARPNQGTAAFNRNPLSGSSFTGLYVEEKVTVDRPEDPEVPEDADFKALGPDDELPAQPALVTPAAQPSYPVYPAMPKAVSYPQKPAKPEDPKLQETVMVKAEDTQGPGCGWSFTGSPGATWDASAARDENTKVVDEATARLDDGVASWSNLTLAYWEDARKYQEALAKYLTYGEQVAEVNAAWSKIAGTWNTYETNLANWQQREDAIKQFNEDKELAGQRYEKELEQCRIEASKPKPTPTPTPATEPEVDPETDEEVEPPAPSVEPEEPAEPVNCQETVAKPAILSESAPEPLEKPTEPSDPRPKE